MTDIGVRGLIVSGVLMRNAGGRRRRARSLSSRTIPDSARHGTHTASRVRFVSTGPVTPITPHCTSSNHAMASQRIKGWPATPRPFAHPVSRTHARPPSQTARRNDNGRDAEEDAVR